MLRTKIVLAAALSLATSAAPGADVAAGASAPANGPILALDAGGHTATVNKVLFTPDGKELITVSHDKTIRFWDVATGEPLRVLRPPIGPGPEGKLYAAALAPDGRTLAVGGFTAPNGAPMFPIYLISLDRGEITLRLAGHTDVISGLAFSPNGRRLISGSNDTTARIWNVATGECEQTLSGHTAAIFGVVVSPDGRQCATASDDKTAAVWSTDSGERLATLTGHTAEVECIDWSPDGRWIVTGGDDESLRVWTPEGRLQQTFFASIQGHVNSVRFAADSRRLLATHGDRYGPVKFVSGNRAPVATIIDVVSRTQKLKFSRHTNTIFDAVFTPDGALAASTGGDNSEILLWRTSDGELLQTLVSVGRKPWAAAWDPAGDAIAWGETNVGSALELKPPLERAFDLAQHGLGRSLAGDWRRAQLERGSLRLELSGKNSVAVRRGDAIVATLQPTDEYDRRYDLVRCFTLLPDQRAAVGSNFDLRIYDTDTGNRVREFIGHTGAVWAVAPSPDGRYLLSASNDMTLRVWNLRADASRAVGIIGFHGITTEKGYEVTQLIADGGAAASGELQVGDTIIGVGETRDAFQPAQGLETEQINKLTHGDVGTIAWLNILRPGQDEPIVIGVTRRPSYAPRQDPLLNLFFAGDDWIAWTPQGYYAASPGGERLMGWHVNNGKDKLASFYPAAQFRKQFYRPDVIKQLLETGSVQLALAATGSKEQVTEVAENLPPQVEIVTPAASQLETTATEIEVTVAATPTGRHPVTSLQLLLNGRPLGGQGGIIKLDGQSTSPRHTFTVPLISGVTHQLQGRADSAVSYGVSKPVAVTVKSSTPDTILPALYVLAIGVSDYDDPELTLNFADDDARSLSEAVQSLSTGLFRKIEVKLLTDKQATQRGILGGLGWLKQQMTQHDVGVLFYSGHGGRDESANFYLLPSDVDRSLPLLVSGVSDANVKSILQGMPGRVVVMLDACHAGTLGGDTRKADFSLTDDLVRDLATDDYGIVVMASSMGREFSLENGEHQSGMFTLAIIEGLRGKADFNQDATVYFNELDTYVSDRVKELSNGRQHPVTAKPATVRSFPLSRIAAQ